MAVVGGLLFVFRARRRLLPHAAAGSCDRAAGYYHNAQRNGRLCDAATLLHRWDDGNVSITDGRALVRARCGGGGQTSAPDIPKPGRSLCPRAADGALRSASVLVSGLRAASAYVYRGPRVGAV